MTDQEQITHGQLGFLCFSFLSGFSTLFLIEAKLVKQDVWISDLFAIGVSVGVLWLLCYVQGQHPQLSMAETCEKLLGKWFAKLVLVIYLVYFLDLGVAAYRAISWFYTTAILPNTPPNVLILLIVLLSSYAVYLGLGTLVRTVQLILPFFILTISIVSVFILREVEINPFLPMFQSKISEVVYGGMVSFGFPFGKVVVFGFLLSQVKNTKKIFVSSAAAIALSGVYLLMASYLTFGSLGMNLTKLSAFPFFSAIQLVKFGEYMERLEILIIAIWTIFTLFELIVLQYVFILVIKQVFKIKEAKPFILPIGLLFYALSQISHTTIMDLAAYDFKILPFSTLIPSAIIPVLLAIITLVKKRQRSLQDLVS
ncbi:Spore germination protein [Paenibacillus sp. yr247]|nr:Spore germination protein [Paenibacillus sp. yr247]